MRIFAGARSSCRFVFAALALAACTEPSPGSGAVASCVNDDGAFAAEGTVCRPAVGPCDVAEVCSGLSASCPPDRFRPADTMCRARAGACDVAETCTGRGPHCPADAFALASFVCRPSTGACDLEETCTGKAAGCPTDRFLPPETVCRHARGPCDVAEACTGTAPQCPSDLLLSSSEICREAQGACDAAERCTGSSPSCPEDVFLAEGAVCRPSTGGCDLPEQCTGAAPSCPGDTFSAAGLTCDQSGGNACDGHGACVRCANLCQRQVSCPGAITTRVSGTVFMPNGVDPLPNTLVYVPNAALQPLPSGVQTCTPCGAQVSGSPLVSATTDATGRFTLEHVPAGADIPLVIQNGKWRREFVIPWVPACVDTALPSAGASQLRMPRNRGEGNIPRIALVTGGFAALECVLLKLGLDPQEFGNGGPHFPGRVHFYLADGNPGARYDADTPSETDLWASQTNLNEYDLIFFGCQGSRFRRSTIAQQKLVNYANAGGRVIANHYALEWLYNVAPFSSTALWNVDQPVSFTSDPQAAFIDTSYPPAQVLAQWLEHVAPSGTPGQVPISHLYTDFDAAMPPARVWLSLEDALHPNPVPMQFTFDTPVGAPADQQCGRVLFTEYHTMEHLPDGTVFPSACTLDPLRPDERLMEFMIFDQGTCR